MILFLSLLVALLLAAVIFCAHGWYLAHQALVEVLSGSVENWQDTKEHWFNVR